MIDGLVQRKNGREIRTPGYINSNSNKLYKLGQSDQKLRANQPSQNTESFKRKVIDRIKSKSLNIKNRVLFG